MQNKLLNYIKRYELFRRGDSVLVAVSGGADSVALLCALHEMAGSLGISLAVAHLNHCIRGKASDADAGFVGKLAARLGIPFTGGRTDVPRLARQKGISMEMAARKARYEFLTDAARKVKADIVVTAHTADDQAETVLLKLARGAGPRGLSGIPRRITMDGLKIVRPILDIRRKEIEEFLRARKQAWREDKTNLDSAYLRNCVRHEVLPFLEKKLNPEIRTALIRTSEIMREENKWLDHLSAGLLKKCITGSEKILNIKFVNRQCVAAKRRILRQWLSLAGVHPELIDFDVVVRLQALLDATKGTVSMEIAGNWIVKRRYDRLIIEQGHVKAAKGFKHAITIPGITAIAGLDLTVETSLKPGLIRDKNLIIGRFPAKASVRLPAGRKPEIIVRSWRNGDRMKPFGMTGSKKLHHIFIDAKVPVEERKNIPVFECNGEIIWIPGYRVAQGWEVRNPSDVSLQILIR